MVEFSGVRNRIEKLKELGLETDGTDGGDVVLLSVVQQEYGAEREEGPNTAQDGADIGDRALDGHSTGEEEEEEEEEVEEPEDQADFGGLGPEVRLPSPEIRVSTSPDSSIPSPEPPASEADTLDRFAVMDQVRKLQLMQRSPVTIKRARSYTDTKK